MTQFDTPEKAVAGPGRAGVSQNVAKCRTCKKILPSGEAEPMRFRLGRPCCTFVAGILLVVPPLAAQSPKADPVAAAPEVRFPTVPPGHRHARELLVYAQNSAAPENKL